MPSSQELPAIQVHQKTEFILAVMPAKLLVEISYVAVRGQSDEDGAVQRILNRDRLTSLRKYALDGGAYPSSIILNWTNEESISYDDGVVYFTNHARSAQIIDGQHRVEGLRAAISEDESIGDMQIPVSIFVGLDTRKCADLFLSINTEQKPVPRSLVFDLYGIASEAYVDPAAVRARDVVMHLNEDISSPYYEDIKLPNQPIRKGGIALSTAVAAVKPLVEAGGILEQINVNELSVQQKILINFFTALSSKYGRKWREKTNAFMFAAGFQGAVDFLKLKMIPLCNESKDFSTEFMSSKINLNNETLILQEEVKGAGGKDAPRKIFDRLVESMTNSYNDLSNYKF